MSRYGEHLERRAALIERYGEPRPLAASDALALARASGVSVDPAVTPDQAHASLYPSMASAEGWLDSNLENYGHPRLAVFELPDGQVIGILDLRPALERAREVAQQET